MGGDQTWASDCALGQELLQSPGGSWSRKSEEEAPKPDWMRGGQEVPAQRPALLGNLCLPVTSTGLIRPLAVWPEEHSDEI